MKKKFQDIVRVQATAAITAGLELMIKHRLIEKVGDVHRITDLGRAVLEKAKAIGEPQGEA